MSTVTVHPASALSGTVVPPADKSIAHRAAMLSAMADGTSRIVNWPSSADPASTLACLRQLGVETGEEDGVLLIYGGTLHRPSAQLDCGNSGTTMRLLSGILAGHDFDATLMGDASLTPRPMQRIMDPLLQMGARIESTDGHAPLRVRGSRGLQGITYRLPVASAQVKSTVLLAGLFAEGETTVIESTPTRDHTERMLGLSTVEMGEDRYISSTRENRPRPGMWSIPGDFSAAAFFIAAASIVPDALIRITGVGLNPSRTALLDILRAMGAGVDVRNERTVGGERLADLTVRNRPLSGVQVSGSIVANAIDELPILCVACCAAGGPSDIRDAGELRHKETDRIQAMTAGLRALGADITEHADGWTIRGGKPLTGGHVDSCHDHRIAMALGVAALSATDAVHIHGAEIAAVSYPGFWDELARVAIR
ncbi:MAG: 3-phosphoshikimate 1-carboxyvinyltransferase [Bacteroidetes bacterium CG12_big_fil_rev_8_21_14_0_65_60_17]|nr:MAG: 3-phosphoshikimate 1-carboxyvinyltransferase [Bacteroidetes bacterium CG12_big_fil_rev_8_21_14_0_65_60_17]